MNVIILGGGCFGTQYARWLTLARERSKTNFENLVIVDRNKDCRIYSSSEPFDFAQGKLRESRSIKLEISDWTDFLVGYIKNAEADTKDLIVPSHTAPHILGRTFLTLILRANPSTSLRTGSASREVEGSSRRSLPRAKSRGSNNKEDFEAVSMFDIQTKICTPFEKQLEKGVVAVSMATWRCPANCTEPEICPRTHAPRNWDLEVSLRSWAEKAKLDEFFVFPARHYAFAVSAIPARTVIGAWHSLQNRLQKRGDYTMGVATSSACHGIISVFKVSVSRNSMGD